MFMVINVVLLTVNIHEVMLTNNGYVVLLMQGQKLTVTHSPVATETSAGRLK